MILVKHKMVISMHKPSYLDLLDNGHLQARVSHLKEMLENCVFMSSFKM